MSKYFLEDIVNKKQHRKEIKKVETKEMQEGGEIKTNYIINKSRYMLWFVAFISVLFCVFAFSFVFSKAEVKIDPKIKDIVLNENLSASEDSNNNTLFFDLVKINEEESKNIQANGEKDVFEKAIGSVIIFNTFSSSSQALNIDTRLEGSNGKIYKTQTKTVVPGMGKNNTPGSVEVKIYAAEAGEEYNSSPLDFKILGFKGTSKYSKFYGRSKGEIVGGFKGKVPAISISDEVNAINDLKNALQAKLLQKATDHPDEVVLFKDAVFISLDDSNILSTYNKDNSTTFTLKGTLFGILFNEKEITKRIAKNNIDKYDGSDIYIQNIEDLTFSLLNKENILFDNIKNIDFNLSGSIKIVWKIDVDKFTTVLLNKSKKDFSQILSQYPNINSAILTLSPFWKMSLPNKVEKIKIVVNYPK
ncbi:MAG: hypothetical protein WC884_00620 [Candidatus Paceibacterota bacterium]